jgi:exosortase family protein XrtM
MTATPRRFALVFVVAFAALYSGFEALRGTAFERFVIEEVFLRPAAALINLVTPGEHVQLAGRSLGRAGGPSLHVVRGCEGIEMLLLLLAALIAFPATLRRRAEGLLWGSLLAYALALARLVLLYYVLRYSPPLWEALHGLVLPLGPVVLLALYFLHWSASAVPRPSHAT